MKLKKAPKDMPILEVGDQNLVLFHPFIPPSAKNAVNEVLSTRWIGQGPKVEIFETMWQKKFGGRTIAVNSGTSALHLAYELADIKKGDEVIVPLFTCTATNIPLAQIGAKLRFCDISTYNLNSDADQIIDVVTDRTKAIVVVHYAGQAIDMKKLFEFCKKKSIVLIQDCAHGIGMEIGGKQIYKYADYTMFSLQAIKTITVGDGGMVTLNDCIPDYKYKEAKRRRWFGIDREKKQGGIWENDIVELGHKWQMTDIAAALGIEALKYFDEIWKIRNNNLISYVERLSRNENVRLLNMNIDSDFKHGSWLATIAVPNRLKLQEYLYSKNIETNQVHYRNDRYSIFEKYLEDQSFSNMDKLEDDYLVLPSHHLITINDVDRICDMIKTFYR